MHFSSRIFACLLFCLVLAAYASAKKIKPADFPLRVHMIQHSEHSHYQGRVLDEVDGDGRGNLFENSRAVAFDFSYTCWERPVSIMGYETYMARWKKPGRELEILLPVMDSPDNFSPCALRVTLKPASVYAERNGQLSEVPANEYKKWLDKQEYDPEHGLNPPSTPSALPARSENQ